MKTEVKNTLYFGESLLERLVKHEDIHKLHLSLENGISLTHTDEYGKDVVDYAIKYMSIKVLNFLISKKILVVDRGFFVVNTSKTEKKLMFRFDEYSRHNQFYKNVEHVKYSNRHNEILELVIKNKDYSLLRKCLNAKIKVVSRNSGQTIPSWIGVGRLRLNLNEEILKFVAKSGDIDLVKILCGLDNVVHPRDYDDLESAVKLYGNKDIKLKFVEEVLQYNENAKTHNDHLYEEKTIRVGNKVKKVRTGKDQNKTYYRTTILPYQSWMVENAMSDFKIMKKISYHLNDDLVNESLAREIVSKYSINMLPDCVSYKHVLKAERTVNEKYITHIDSFYKNNYHNFPIMDVLKRLKDFPELQKDVITFTYKFKKMYQPLVINNKKFKTTMSSRNLRTDSYRILGAKHGYGLQYDLPASIPNREITNKIFKLDQEIRLPFDNYLYYLAKFSNSDILYVTSELFTKEEKDEALKKLILKKNSNGIRKLSISEFRNEEKYNKIEAYHDVAMGRNTVKFYNAFKSDNNLRLLIKDSKLLKEVADTFTTEVLDKILNELTCDNNFDQIAYLIDQGASLYSSYIAQEDDGWGYMIDVKKSEKDLKKTAVMREMIRQLVENK